MSGSNSEYFIPEPSRWPIVGSVALMLTLLGVSLMLNGSQFGIFLFGLGVGAVIYMFLGWFSDVINESQAGHYNQQVDTSFRWGIVWFIFSEVMFFAAFFAALYYARVLSVPWLGGEGEKELTHLLLWPDFFPSWPLFVMPDPSSFSIYDKVIPASGVPAFNTIILLSSGLTVTLAHFALKKENRTGLCRWLLATVLLGLFFIYLQVGEYFHAYNDLNLTLKSGVYGSTFYLLTGFHGFHVMLGALMLIVIWLRSLKGHFSSSNHFAFEAVAWYWHFVDVVWLILFIFVYCI